MAWNLRWRDVKACGLRSLRPPTKGNSAHKLNVSCGHLVYAHDQASLADAGQVRWKGSATHTHTHTHTHTRTHVQASLADAGLVRWKGSATFRSLSSPASPPHTLSQTHLVPHTPSLQHSPNTPSPQHTPTHHCAAPLSRPPSPRAELRVLSPAACVAGRGTLVALLVRLR